MRNSDEAYDDFMAESIWQDAKPAGIQCPLCGNGLFQNTIGQEPDTMETWLLCKKCNYKEKE